MVLCYHLYGGLCYDCMVCTVALTTGCFAIICSFMLFVFVFKCAGLHGGFVFLNDVSGLTG